MWDGHQVSDDKDLIIRSWDPVSLITNNVAGKLSRSLLAQP